MPEYRFEMKINADNPEKAQEIVDATKKAVNEHRASGFDGLMDVFFGRLTTPEGQEVRTGGWWITHYEDWSGFAVFGTELEAVRHAVEHSQKVTFAEWGDVR